MRSVESSVAAWCTDEESSSPEAVLGVDGPGLKVLLLVTDDPDIEDSRAAEGGLSQRAVGGFRVGSAEALVTSEVQAVSRSRELLAQNRMYLSTILL